MAKKVGKAYNKTESKMVKSLDDLKEFEDFKSNLLPKIQKELLAGTTPDRLGAKFSTEIMARIVNIALTSESDSVAMTAAKDVLDRTMGQATKKIETTNFVELRDEELDSLLETTLKDAGLSEADLEEISNAKLN